MIKFKKLRAKNFLSIGNIFLEYTLDKYQNTCFVGDSGAGKSLIEDLISFSLFNKSYRNINKGQLVNNINKSQCVVEIEFEINNKLFKVVRGIKPNIFEIYVDNEMLQYGSDMNELQAYLENHILKINYKSFIQTSVIAPAGFTSFMQLTSPQRKEIIENILDINIFSLMAQNSKEKLKVANNEYNNTQNQLKILVSETESQRKYIDLIKKSLDDKTEEIKIKINKLKLSKDKLTKELKEVEFEYKKLVEPIKDESITQNERNLNKNIIEHEQEIKLIKKDISFYSNHEECPTCSQHIESNYKKNTIEQLNKKLKDNENKININKSLLTENLKKLEIQNKNINSYQNLKNEFKSKMNNLIYSLKEVEKNIFSYTNELNEVKPIYDIEEENNKLKKLKSEGKKLSIESEDIKKQKDLLTTVVSLFKDDVLKKVILSKYVPIINYKINEYLKILELPIRFAFDDTFTEKILAQNQDNYSYNSFSAGEKSRLDLAIIFTLRDISAIKNSLNTSLLLIDEVFDSSLDSASTENLMKILKTLKNTNIIVISHKSDVEDFFDRTLRFTKVNGFTKYIET